MYKYILVEAQNETMFNSSDYEEIINKYAQAGWRFVSAIPKSFTGHGVIKKFDLVFEKEVKELQHGF